MFQNSNKFNLLYVVVPEFQKRGAVHYHVVFFNLPFIPNIHPVLTKLWGQGHIFGKLVYDSNHLANYISKYITKKFDEKHSKFSKRFFSSRSLKKPYVLMNEQQISYILPSIDTKNYPIEQNEFTTPLGINIKQVVIKFPDGFNTKKLLF